MSLLRSQLNESSGALRNAKAYAIITLARFSRIGRYLHLPRNLHLSYKFKTSQLSRSDEESRSVVENLASLSISLYILSITTLISIDNCLPRSVLSSLLEHLLSGIAGCLYNLLFESFLFLFVMFASGKPGVARGQSRLRRPTGDNFSCLFGSADRFRFLLTD